MPKGGISIVGWSLPTSNISWDSTHRAMGQKQFLIWGFLFPGDLNLYSWQKLKGIRSLNPTLRKAEASDEKLQYHKMSLMNMADLLLSKRVYTCYYHITQNLLCNELRDVCTSDKILKLWRIGCTVWSADILWKRWTKCSGHVFKIHYLANYYWLAPLWKYMKCWIKKYTFLTFHLQSLLLPCGRKILFFPIFSKT